MRIRFLTFMVRGFTRARVSAAWLATQMLPAPAASPYGLWPSRTLPLTLTAFGSMRTSRLRVRSVVQSEPLAEIRMPPVVPIWIFAGGAEADEADAKQQTTRTTTVAQSARVRRCHKVVPLYHKIDVN